MHTLGLDGMPRRIYTYHAGLGWGWQNMFITVGAFVFAAGLVVFIVNLFWSLRHGEIAGDNPWDAATLEWATTSPPPSYNFARIPVVASRHPLWEDRLDDSPDRSQLDGPVVDEGRDTFGVSGLDAEPNEILRMPEDTPWPFILSLSILIAFYGALASVWWLFGVGALGVLVAIIGWFWPRAEMAPPGAPA
jgi:cytochrome c oxidase subunit 1/cytochrome c oxidase subunit I+III